MVKRNSRLGFLGGAHVFPGGAVDEADRSESFDALLVNFDCEVFARRLELDDLVRARGYLVAGVRELFEEAGVLLAGSLHGAAVDLEETSARAQRLLSRRAAVASGADSFERLLRDSGLVIDASKLLYFAHGITPVGERKRFDTRFFLAAMPDRQAADHDRGESVEGEWLAPAQALDRYAHREIELVPPTICALDRLALHDSVDDALRAAQALDVVEVLPKICISDSGVTILYPGDEDYDEGVARPRGPGRLLNRLILRDGVWGKP